MKIGFKNFKKFKDFPMIELAPITFLVGPNNSGKSSFIKALTLLQENINLMLSQKGFLDHYFKRFIKSGRKIGFKSDFMGSVSFEEINSRYGWGGLPAFVMRGENNDTLELSWSFEQYCISIIFGASLSERLQFNALNLHPYIKTVEIRDLKNGTILVFDSKVPREEGQLYFKEINLLKYAEWIKKKIEWIDYRIGRRNERFEPSSNSNSYNSDINRKSTYIEFDEFELKFHNKHYNDRIENEKSLYEDILKYIEDENPILVDVNLHGSENDVVKATLSTYAYFIVNQFESATRKNLKRNIFYIEAHNASHDLILKADDKNNYLTATTNQYFSEVYGYEYITVDGKDTHIYDWLCKQLKNLGVCGSFKILSKYDGTAYEIKISDRENVTYEQNSELFYDLGTKGTGSIQIFILLLRIGVALARLYHEGSDSLIIVEEPEQNLHPALQSSLADLFLKVFEISNQRIAFVVETHSEYLIRRTQVMVAKEHYPDEETLEKKNPFKVYYFPKEGLPYDMKYETSGEFINVFDEGFFDESARWLLEILNC